MTRGSFRGTESCSEQMRRGMTESSRGRQLGPGRHAQVGRLAQTSERLPRSPGRGEAIHSGRAPRRLRGERPDLTVPGTQLKRVLLRRPPTRRCQPIQSDAARRLAARPIPLVGEHKPGDGTIYRKIGGRKAADHRRALGGRLYPFAAVRQIGVRKPNGPDRPVAVSGQGRLRGYLVNVPHRHDRTIFHTSSSRAATLWMFWPPNVYERKKSPLNERRWQVTVSSTRWFPIPRKSVR